ncbi:uncharacterized protein EI97DRAFT_292530 [Westerdykella ornata]|uniref:Uncharacterized protein n=1 Tax=Westerdykella ornata TaxID=318751 RepID=A0A6A6JMW9_WESOR|nr:uncharacterized protein EI97DRAFT_292530 [Westerdykella ornata]KAF2277463.1 hypothetical protein EI97DRAFT_292530 [Westerdykella ornata]
MTSQVDGESWTIIPSIAMASTITPTQPDAKSPATETNAGTSPDTIVETETTDKSELENTAEEDTFTAKPDPGDSNTADQLDYDDELDGPIRHRRVPIYPGRRNYSPNRPNPVFLRARDEPEPFCIPAIHSSAKLLAQLNTYDGVVDLPFPARSSVYLTTFPFTRRDVIKYSGLFAHPAEGVFISETKHTLTEFDEYPVYPNRPPRNRGDYYDPIPFEDNLPRIFLSRALDTAVVPEDKGAKFWIVVQSRQRPNARKLLVMESRKAAGIVIYYEALNGNSVIFVGAVLGERKTGAGIKMKKVDSLEEAVKAQEEGVVGIIC